MRQQDHPEGSNTPERRGDIIRTIWETWKQVGRFIGDMIARVVLSLLYVTLFVPFAVGTRAFGDPLDIKVRSAPTLWLQRNTRDLTLDDARRQF